MLKLARAASMRRQCEIMMAELPLQNFQSYACNGADPWNLSLFSGCNAHRQGVVDAGKEARARWR